MPEILTSEGQIITCREGMTLLEALRESGVAIESPCGGMGKCGKCRVKISGNVPPPCAEDSACLTEREISEGFRLACMTKARGNITVKIPEPERGHDILSSGYVPDFVHDIVKDSFGLAVDIGTTTLAASLVDIKSGAEIDTAGMINPQREQGLDVLSRITFAGEHSDGLKLLQRSIVLAVNDVAGNLCRKNHIPFEALTDIAISANTTMLHLFFGVNPRSLGVKPFAPVFTESTERSGESLGMKDFPGARVFSLPSVSAYIGADITAGAYVCSMSEAGTATLFIDIGTNGEMILSHGGKLTACSCAAGPALEGMNISCGMRASEGAIEDVKISADGKISVNVIGNCEPSGICGSGILGAVREFIRAGFISVNGRINPAVSCRIDGKSALRLTDNIYITQSDIRQVQLAKGAILSGVEAMLSAEGIEASDLRKIIVAGQFGAHLPAESLTGCGIVPEISGGIIYAGNTSKTGAMISLLSSKAISDMNTLARSIKYIELAELENYDRLFAECMRFPRK